MAQHNITVESNIVKGLFLYQAPEAVVQLMESILNPFLEAQASEVRGGSTYQRS